jgi:hypothetical protein
VGGSDGHGGRAGIVFRYIVKRYTGFRNSA